MSDTTTPSLVEPPPHAQEGTFTDEAAWDLWTNNGPATIAWHIGWSGGGYGYDTEADVKDAWPQCPGDNWTEAENCDEAKRILRDEEKEVYGVLTYRSVLTNSYMCGPDRTKDGWNLVGSCSAGSQCEVQVDDSNTMRYTDIAGTVSVYECPTEFVCSVIQCRPGCLLRGANALLGEGLLSVPIDGTSTVENVLDGLEDSLQREAWEGLSFGSDESVAQAVREAIATHRGLKWSEEDCFDDDALEKIWDDSLLEDNGEGPTVYILIRPA